MISAFNSAESRINIEDFRVSLRSRPRQTVEDRDRQNVPICVSFGVDARYQHSSGLIPTRASRTVHDLEKVIYQWLAVWNNHP